MNAESKPKWALGYLKGRAKAVALRRLPPAALTTAIRIAEQHGVARDQIEAAVQAWAKTAGTLILSVDDRPASLYLRDRILRDHGFHVANAESGHEAVEVARRQRPQLILLDVYLPDADGRELCQRFKVDPAFRDVPVVLISAQLPEDGGSADTARPGGADGFLREPVSAELLVSTLKQALGKVA